MSDRRFASVFPPASQATPGSICFARTGKKAKVAGLTAGLTLHGPFRVWGGGMRAATPHVLGVRSPASAETLSWVSPTLAASIMGRVAQHHTQGPASPVRPAGCLGLVRR